MNSDSAASLISKRIPHQISSDKLFLKSAVRHPTLPSQVATSPRACADSYTSIRVPPSCLSSSRRLHGTIGSTPLTRIVQAHTVHCHRLLPCMHQPRNRREAGPRSHRVTLPREGGRTALACVSTRNVQSRKKPPSKCAVRLNSCSTASPCRQPSLLPDDAAFVGLGPPLRAPASAVQTCSATMKKNTHATMMVGRCGYDKLFPQKKVRKVTARDHGRCNKCTYSSTHCAPSTNTERLHNSGQEANARTTTHGICGGPQCPSTDEDCRRNTLDISTPPSTTHGRAAMCGSVHSKWYPSRHHVDGTRRTQHDWWNDAALKKKRNPHKLQ